MSGPEVIESSHGVEEFDARDRALVWRTTGGKHRYLTGDCDALVDDDVAAFRHAAIAALSGAKALTLEGLEHEHALLNTRIADFGHCGDSTEIWQAMGVHDPMTVAELDAHGVHELKTKCAKELA
jgi:malonate decarboxylase beta subunit